MDQDLIEDSSPIKDKFSEYKPVDHKANKYFTLDKEEEEYDRFRQREKGMETNYRQSRNAPPNEKERTVNSRFNDRSDNKQANSRTKVASFVDYR